MATGFLSRTLSRIRLFTDEPSTNAKYTDADLLDLIRSSWTDVLGEIMRVTSKPIVVRHDISVAGQDGITANTYILPPTVGSILRIAKINTNTGNSEWDVVPRSRWNPDGPGVLFEGRAIKFQPDWAAGSYTLRVEYTPTGDLDMHIGTVDASAFSNDTSANTCTVVLASSPDTGSLDLRPNAYAGGVLRILSCDDDSEFPVQDRLITAYDYSTRTATLSPALTEAPATGDITYEVATPLGEGFDMVVALDVAAIVLGVEGDDKRSLSTQKQYARKLRSIRLNEANFEAIVGQRFEHDTAQNEYRMSW